MATFTNSTVPGNEDAIIGAADRAIGVQGTSNAGTGVRGVSNKSIGVYGASKAGPSGSGRFLQAAGVHGNAEHGVGVFGQSKHNAGVAGESDTWYGVAGESTSGVGVYGSCQTNEAIHGVTNSPAAAAVIGINNSTGPGIRGVSKGFDGVSGESQGHGKAGVAGYNEIGIGVLGTSKHGAGVHAVTDALTVAAIAGYNNNIHGTGAAIYGKKEGALGHAGYFVGNVHVDGKVYVTGDIELSNGDCAEHFDVADMATAEPGTVMVLGEKGLLYPSQDAYDKRVAGVVSGAGDYKPGIVLDRQEADGNRQPIALLGKVYCKVDAQYGAIEVGDLLTTSPTPGHAMRASDPGRAFGAVLGKALRGLPGGCCLVPVLVGLQ